MQRSRIKSISKPEIQRFSLGIKEPSLSVGHPSVNFADADLIFRVQA